MGTLLIWIGFPGDFSSPRCKDDFHEPANISHVFFSLLQQAIKHMYLLYVATVADSCLSQRSWRYLDVQPTVLPIIIGKGGWKIVLVERSTFAQIFRCPSDPGLLAIPVSAFWLKHVAHVSFAIILLALEEIIGKLDRAVGVKCFVVVSIAPALSLKSFDITPNVGCLPLPFAFFLSSAT